MTAEILLNMALLAMAIAFWFWFGTRMNGIHAESKRTADLLETINRRELKKESAERQARAIAELDPAPDEAIAAASARIQEETRKRAGL